MGTPAYCEATFHYHDGVEAVPVTSTVLDGRRARDDIDFERSGFGRVDHASAVRDWHDPCELDQVYRPELAEFATEFTWCDVAISFPLISRSVEAALTEPDYGPIEFVHSDFTSDYGPMVTGADRPYRAFVDPLLAEQGLARRDLVDASRLMVLQWWRNIGPVDADTPLAMCDASAIPESRLMRQVVPFYGGLRLDFEIFAVRPPDPGTSDDWYTYPRMTDEEVIVLRTYDSARVDAGTPYWTPHSAFRDPHVDGAPEHRRESVEGRALCIWH